MSQKLDSMRNGNTKKTIPPRRAEFRSTTPALEWIFAISGFILVTLMLTFIGMNAARDDRSPPEVAVRSLSIIPSGKGFLVLIRAENKGGTTATALNVEGVLKEGEKEVASSNMTFDYLPAESFRSGGLFFDKDPSKYNLELRALGYQEP